MHEIKKLVQAYDRIDFTKRKAALATVVKLYGSSYRRPGARMLVSDDGRWMGAISGGCLEGDALRKARAVMEEKKPRLVTYDTMDDDNNTLGIALGCNGIIDVLIEPLEPKMEQNPVEILRKAVEGEHPSVMATVYHSEDENKVTVGERTLVDYKGRALHEVKGKNHFNLMSADIGKALEGEQSVSKVYEMFWGKAEVFIEAITPNVQLVIYGGGYDAVPLCQLAAQLGWDVLVADNCIAHLAPKRFPAAKAVIQTEGQEFLSKVHINPYTAVVLMSHDYYRDLSILKEVLKSKTRYIGVLGPKKRGEKMKDALTKENIALSEKDELRFHNPCGLDIGAETPEEIALSIVSEIQAHVAGRKGQKLKNREGYIHERTEKGAHPIESDRLETPRSCVVKPGMPDL